jgi:hypothetical protein
MKEKVVSREQAIEQLWEAGVLDWKLTVPQKIIKQGIVDDKSKISVVMCARRLGKSYLALTMAIEACLKNPDTIVKYVFPKQASPGYICKRICRRDTAMPATAPKIPQP